MYVFFVIKIIFFCYNISEQNISIWSFLDV